MIKITIHFYLALLLLNACKSKQETTSPIEEKITESVYASGIIKTKNQYQVFSAANGLIAEILVAEGDAVKKGDALIRLTNTAAQLNTDNARIALDYASVNANKEKLDELKYSIDLAKTKLNNDALLLKRQQNLWNEQIGTRNDLDQRALAYKSSANNYEAAKLRYAEMQKQINFQQQQSHKNLQISKTIAGDYTIRSAVNGKVYHILKEIGQKIVLSMDSHKGQVFEATVEKINPIMNERSKSFTIEAYFTKQPAVLYPNLTCEANIVIQQKEKTLTIPRNYLLEGDYVLLANKEKRKVTTGLKDYQKVEILNGLTIKDIIINPTP